MSSKRERKKSDRQSQKRCAYVGPKSPQTGGQELGPAFSECRQSPSSMERPIIQLHQMGFSRLKIAEGLHVGHGRIDSTLDEWKSTGPIRDAKPSGRPRTVTLPIQEFINVRTIQGARLSCQALSAQIAERYHIPVSTRTVNRYRRLMHFHYQPARHI
jgi:transposase